MAVKREQRISLEIQQLCDLAECNARMIHIRWIAGALVILAAVFFKRVMGLPIPEIPLVLVGGGILVYNTALTWGLRQADNRPAYIFRKHVHRIMFAQMALDWAGLVSVLYLTGGAASPLIPFILIQALVFALLLPGWRAYLATILGVGALALAAALSYTGLFPPQKAIPAFPIALHSDPVYVLSVIAATALTALALVYLASTLLVSLRGQEIRIDHLIRSSERVASTTILGELLQEMVRDVAETLAANGALLRLLDETGEQMTLTAVHGLSKTYQEYCPLNLSESPLDQDIIDGRPAVVNTIEDDARIRHPRHAAMDGIRSLAAVPVVGRGQPLGILSVYSDRVGYFSMADAYFLQAAASQCATAIENTRICEQLEHADETRTRFVRTLTHELRAPVGGAQTLLRTLMRGLAGELSVQQRDILGRLEKRMDSLMELINDMLSLSASKTVDLEAPLEQIMLKPVMEAIIERFSSDAENKRIKLTYFAVPEVLSVLATLDGLERIFSNLISNAIKYTPSGGKVEVILGEQVGKAVVTVSDTGIGIPINELSELWVDFFRASNARRSGIPGTGLGLSIVKQLVNHFGGTVDVRSTEGKGTTFKVMLPLARMPLVNPVEEMA